MSASNVNLESLLKVGIFACLLLAAGSGAASEVPERVVGDEPLKPDEILFELGLISKERLLGPYSPLSEVLNGGVSFGKWQVSLLPPMGDIASSSQADFYLVWAPFSIHPPEPGRKYQEVVYRVMLSEPSAKVFDVFPSVVTDESPDARTAGLSAQLKFVGRAAPDLRELLTITNLRPVIHAFGVGESHAYWRYESIEDRGVDAGVRHVFFVLEVPPGTKALAATLSATATMAKYVGDMAVFPKAKTTEEKIAAPLPVKGSTTATGGSP